MDIFDRRISGILLHPTSLPSEHGIGDLGNTAYRFVDLLEASEQRIWQMLPTGPQGRSYSPYDVGSAFAGNPLLIGLDPLVELGLLDQGEADPDERFPKSAVDYPKVQQSKTARLRLAFAHARSKSPRGVHRRMLDRFDAFCERSSSWLPDYTLFLALKRAHRGRAWSRWSHDLRDRRAAAIREATKNFEEEIEFHAFTQFLFDEQWNALRTYANDRGIAMVGDVPIYVALEGPETWANPRLFDLKDGRPKTIAGVPPDYFNRNGQLWGNPTYDWPRHRREDYRWWVDRIAHGLTQFDSLRLDHFIGFHRCWCVSAKASTARRGVWRSGPGAGLFHALRKRVGHAPLIAEDLGLTTPEVFALRDEMGYRGMRILQFAFDGNPENPNLPHNYPRECVIYTGTHDNMTIQGWFDQKKANGERRMKDVKRNRTEALGYMGSSGKEFHWDVIRLALNSVADTVVFPLQDVLGLGDRARMNRPGTARGNWKWRVDERRLTPEIAERLGSMTAASDRGESGGTRA